MSKEREDKTKQPDQPVAWRYVHPMLNDHVYTNLKEPTSLSEAHRHMVMHRNAVEDIDIQIKIQENNYSCFLIDETFDNDGDMEKYAARTSKYHKRLSVLLNSMVMHKRQAAAYWYWLQCHEDLASDANADS